MAVTLIGFMVLMLGVALLLLPGPGLLVIAFGFAILATEFVWAWRAKRFVQTKARSTRHRTQRSRSDRSLPRSGAERSDRGASSR